MEPVEKLMELLPQEIVRNLAAMSRSKNIDDKKAHSEIILNLCKSLGVFIDATQLMDLSDDMDDEFPFMDDDEPSAKMLEMPQSRGKKKRKKKRDDDLPF
ncbi:MAG: hypothetical protein ACOCW2_04830 [Chitinivibrionales bacterium]